MFSATTNTTKRKTASKMEAMHRAVDLPSAEGVNGAANFDVKETRVRGSADRLTRD